MARAAGAEQSTIECRGWRAREAVGGRKGGTAARAGQRGSGRGREAGAAGQEFPREGACGPTPGECGWLSALPHIGSASPSLRSLQQFRAGRRGGREGPLSPPSGVCSLPSLPQVVLADRDSVPTDDRLRRLAESLLHRQTPPVPRAQWLSAVRNLSQTTTVPLTTPSPPPPPQDRHFYSAANRDGLILLSLLSCSPPRLP